MRIVLSIILVSLFLSGCAAYKTGKDKAQSDLTKFAYANCLMWYFESKGNDTEDIRAISGGMVENSVICVKRFQKLLLAVMSYSSDIESKNNVDLNLLKCFHRKDYEKLNAYLE